jgi:hypothetical protein
VPETGAGDCWVAASETSPKERPGLAGVVAVLVALDARPCAERHVGAPEVGPNYRSPKGEPEVTPTTRR